MAEPYDISKATTTDFKNTVTNVSVDVKSLDYSNDGKDVTKWSYDKATQNFGYYKTIPAIKRSADALYLWAFGKGYEASDEVRTELDGIKGWGEDSFQSILQNMGVMKKIVGDAFAEIIRNGSRIINLKPISPERVRTVTKHGIIQRYEVRNSAGKFVSLAKEKMFHICNNRLGDEIHGTSDIDSVQWVVDAWNEAMVANRMIQNRGKALGIVYYKTDNAGKITFANSQIEKAVKNGEMLGLPEDTAEIKEFPTKGTSDRLEWIRYLENLFYQVFGVPRVIATSEGLTEAGGKAGFLTFEPVYTNEQKLMEQDLWNQMAIKLTFNKPPQLSGTMAEDEEKNAGQVGLQPNDTSAVSGEI